MFRWHPRRDTRMPTRLALLLAHRRAPKRDPTAAARDWTKSANATVIGHRALEDADSRARIVGRIGGIDARSFHS